MQITEIIKEALRAPNPQILLNSTKLYRELNESINFLRNQTPKKGELKIISSDRIYEFYKLEEEGEDLIREWRWIDFSKKREAIKKVAEVQRKIRNWRVRFTKKIKRLHGVVMTFKKLNMEIGNDEYLINDMRGVFEDLIKVDAKLRTLYK